MSARLRPYVPRPVIDWLRDVPEAVHRPVRGTLAFADISGFTSLTERLASRGHVGAEEMGDLLNDTFEKLLVPAYDYGAALIKWGGDATLLLYEGEGHAARACRAAAEMQQTMKRIGRLRTAAGPAILRMSVGVHTGNLDFFLLGSRHRELVVTGPATTQTALAEQLASAGEVVVSPATAAAIGEAHVTRTPDGKLLLTRAPDADQLPQRTVDARVLPELGTVLPRPVREHVSSGAVDSEHRHLTTGFVQFLGADALLHRSGPAALAEALVQVIDAAEQAADRHEVTFLSTDIAADGGKIILVAGAPRSHDRSEERMLCALRNILDQPTELALRAGVANGRAFTGDFGPPYRRTYSIVGDSVNLAARLMGHARPGELIATPQVLERSRTTFTTTALPPFQVKGKSEPVEALLVGAATTADEPADEGTMPLRGRPAELQALTEALARVRHRTGQVLDIVGDPGMGKTRLLEELRTLTDDDVLFLVSCDGYSASTPYEPWRRLLVTLLGGASGPALAEALSQTVAFRCPELVPWTPLLGSLLDLELPSTPEVDALDARFQRTQMGRAVLGLLTAVLDATTVLVFDDVHLMDDASSGLLQDIITQGRERPWLIVTTRRPAAAGFVPRAREGTHTISLAPLDDDAITALLEAMTESAPLLPHELRAIREHAGGNPLFVREMLSVRQRGGDLDALPDSLDGILAAAVDALPALPRQLLRTAAVLGTRFDRRLLDEMLARSGQLVSPEDWAALEPFLAGDATTLTFRNALVRESAYETLPFRRRILMHGQAGEVIERAMTSPSQEELSALSFHFFHAQRYEVAASYSKQAGDRARKLYANVEAALFYGRALEATRRAGRAGHEQLELAEALGDIWYILGEVTKADQAYAEARRLAHDEPLHRARISLLIAKLRRREGRLPQALRTLTRALRDVAGVDLPEAQELAARICSSYAAVRQDQGRQHDAIRWANEAIARASSVDAPDVLANAYQYLDRASISLGCYDHEHKVHEALAIWERLGNLTGQAGVHNQLGIRAFYLGDWRDALRHYGKAREILERAGDHFWAAIAAINIADIYVDQGHLSEAEDLARQSRRVFRAAETAGMTAAASATLARVAARAGRFDEALELFAEAAAGFSEDGEQLYLVETEARRLECLLWQGEAEAALQGAQEVLARAAGADTGTVLPLLYRVCGWALAQQGEVASAQSAFREGLDHARRLNSRNEIALVLDALVRLAEHTGTPVIGELVSERNALVERLGIVSVPHVPLPTAVPAGAVPQPRQWTAAEPDDAASVG